MGWIVSLVIGGVVGWLASIAMKTDVQMGVLANVIVGVIGSALGFWIAALMGISPTGGILRFIIAFGGAVLLLFILQKAGMFEKKA